jgi:hypothetical protein
VLNNEYKLKNSTLNWRLVLHKRKKRGQRNWIKLESKKNNGEVKKKIEKKRWETKTKWK